MIIKFRAWDSYFEEMVYNNFTIDCNGEVFSLTGCFLEHLTPLLITGLKDKEGRDIYQGDLVKVFGNNKGCFEVSFINEYVGGWILKHNLGHFSLGARKPKDLEVVGNIYENLNLVEKNL